MTQPTLANLKTLPYGGAQYVVNSDREKFIHDSVIKAANDHCLWNTDLQKTFLDEYYAWIQNTTLNTFKGIEEFKVRAFSQGTTEAFDKFYLKNSHRRLRYFKGEYMYHQVAGRHYFDYGSAFIEDADIAGGDCVVISLPFSDTGNEHPRMHEVLQKCTELDVPVLLDFAYLGICSGITFDLTYPCITDVTFSLSKTFPVPHLRIGMRLTRYDDDDALLVMNKTGYTNRLSIQVGLDLIRTWTADFIPKQYKEAQERLCQELGVEPSNSIIFGIDRKNQYPEYNRGGQTNRLCFAKILDTKI
jgi:hypothetical protein